MPKTKVVAIIQARMGSTRLPKKTLKDLQGKPLLERVVERVRLCNNVDEIIIATSDKAKDDAIEKFCTKKGFAFFRGAEEDVLDRFYKCAKKFGADIVVRITADNPLVDWENIDAMIKSHLERGADITYTEGMPLGAGPGNCVFSFAALEKAALAAKEKGTTPDPDDAVLEQAGAKKNVMHAPLELRRDYRLTVDYQEDLEFMIALFSRFRGVPKLKDVIKYLDEHPEVARINRHVGK